MSRYRSAKLVSFDPVIRRTCMNNNVRKRNPSDMAENMKTLAPVNNNGKRKDNNSPPQAIVPGFLSTKYSQFHGNPCYPPPSDVERNPTQLGLRIFSKTSSKGMLISNFLKSLINFFFFLGKILVIIEN